MKIRITCLLLVILGVVVNCSGVHEHNKKQGFYSLNEVLSFKSQLHHKDDDKVDIVALQDNQFATVVEFEGGKYAIQVKEYFKNACFINPGTTTSHLLSDSDRSKSLSGIYRASSTLNAFAGLTKDGSVFTCGVDGDFGGNSESVQPYLNSIVSLKSTNHGFIALDSAGSVITWPVSGGRSVITANGAQAVFTTNTSFALLDSKNQVVIWDDWMGDEVKNRLSFLVKQIVASNDYFFFHDGVTVHAYDALNNIDKVIFRLADSMHNAEISALVATKKNPDTSKNGLVVQLKNGQVSLWGDLTSEAQRLSLSKSLADISIKKVVSSTRGIALLSEGGRVFFWGKELLSNDFKRLSTLTDVKDIASNDYAFAALLSDGTVISWGVGYRGGDSSGVKNRLKNVTSVIGAGSFFIANTQSGPPVMWGWGLKTYIPVTD